MTNWNEMQADRYVMKRSSANLGDRPRCLKRRRVVCERESVEKLADRYRRHLYRALSDRGDEIAFAIREEMINYLEHSGGYDASRRLQITSCRIGNHLVFFWGMQTNRRFDPNERRSGKHRGHGLKIINSFADVHLVDQGHSEATGTGSTTIFDLARPD